MDDVRVGSDVPAWCGACKAVTDHKVLAMVGQKIAQVLCECKAQHRYRPAEKPAKRPKLAVVKAVSAPVQEPVIEGKARVAYLPSVRFEIGAAIEHPVFGAGEVVQHSAPAVMEVLFPGGVRRRLVHDRRVEGKSVIEKFK